MSLGPQPDELVVEQEEGLAVLRLNRPERLNALSPPMLRRFEAEVPRLVADPAVRAILITGTGRAFCAGGDVGAMDGPADAEATRAGIEVRRHAVAQHLLGLRARQGGGLATDVRARHREWPRVGEQIQRNAVVGHAQRDGAARLPQVPHE